MQIVLLDMSINYCNTIKVNRSFIKSRVAYDDYAESMMLQIFFCNIFSNMWGMWCVWSTLCHHITDVYQIFQKWSIHKICDCS